MSNAHLLQFIQNILPMPSDKAELIATYFKEVHFSKNDFILIAGQVSCYSYFVQEGSLRAYIIDVDGNEVTTDFFNAPIVANDFLSFFKRIPATDTIVALTNCVCWKISFDDLQICFHTIPEFREFGRMMLINNYSLLKQRTLGMVQLTAEQRYQKLMETNPQLFQQTSLKNIASYLGITDTSLSRIRKELTKK
jgi:CRP-like cAMP-binding protein